jgi:hypothetical protein
MGVVKSCEGKEAVFVKVRALFVMLTEQMLLGARRAHIVFVYILQASIPWLRASGSSSVNV